MEIQDFHLGIQDTVPQLRPRQTAMPAWKVVCAALTPSQTMPRVPAFLGFPLHFLTVVRDQPLKSVIVLAISEHMATLFGWVF